MARRQRPLVDPLEHIPAWLCGAAGGAMASLGQFVGATLPDLVDRTLHGDFYSVMNQCISFLICTAGFVFVGGVAAYFLQSKTQNRWNLFLIGAVFTSVGVQALPGAKRLLKLADLSPISVAYAQTQAPASSCPITIVGGIKQFLRLDDNGYRVVVGSFKNHNDAVVLANKINAADSMLHAFVADKYPGNDFYAVVAGPPSTTLDEAEKIQNKVLTLDFVPGAFISHCFL
jgi:hypothetical protein